MPTIKQQIEAEVTKLQTYVQWLQSLVTSDETTDVQLDSGIQPSFKKYVAERVQAIITIYQQTLDDQLSVEVDGLQQAINDAAGPLQQLQDQFATHFNNEASTLQQALDAANTTLTAVQQQVNDLSAEVPVSQQYVDNAILGVADALNTLQGTVNNLPAPDVTKAYVDSNVQTINTAILSLQSTLNNLPASGVEDVRLGALFRLKASNEDLDGRYFDPGDYYHQFVAPGYLGYVSVGAEVRYHGEYRYMYLRPLQKLINGTWMTVSTA